MGDLNTTAIAINDTGQVLGITRNTNDPNPEANGSFISAPTGVGMTFLGAPAYSIPSDLNDAGQMVGTDRRYAETQAFILTFPGHERYLFPLDFYPSQNATAINNSGQVVVNSRSAFITGPNGMGMIDLGTLLGTQVRILQ
ncbi:MAG: hypothetical protein ABI865_10760 [Nitrosospira sp.]